jgi:hypothetical protein
MYVESINVYIRLSFSYFNPKIEILTRPPCWRRHWSAPMVEDKKRQTRKQVNIT